MPSMFNIAKTMEEEIFKMALDEARRDDRNMSIFAIFRGKNGSMDYRSGHPYELEVGFNNSLNRSWDIIISPPMTSNTSMRSGQICPYSNIEAFLENWHVNRKTEKEMRKKILISRLLD